MARHYGYSNTAVPATPEEMCEFLGDPERVNARLKGKSREEQAAFCRDYGRAFAARDGGETATQLREQVQLGIAEFMKANGGGKIPRGLAPGAGHSARGAAVHNKAAPGAKADGLFTSLGEF